MWNAPASLKNVVTMAAVAHAELASRDRFATQQGSVSARAAVMASFAVMTAAAIAVESALRDRPVYLAVAKAAASHSARARTAVTMAAVGAVGPAEMEAPARPGRAPAQRSVWMETPC